MPRDSSLNVTLYKKWITGDSNFAVDDGKIFCKLCTKSYDFKKKCQFDVHKKSDLHQARVKAPSTDRKQQQLLRDVVSMEKPEVQEFSKDVILAFLKEGIPLHKLENGPLRDIFDKYCGVKLPSVSTLRRIVPQLCEKNLEDIRKDIGESRIWLSVDEATDS